MLKVSSAFTTVETENSWLDRRGWYDSCSSRHGKKPPQNPKPKGWETGIYACLINPATQPRSRKVWLLEGCSKKTITSRVVGAVHCYLLYLKKEGHKAAPRRPPVA